MKRAQLRNKKRTLTDYSNSVPKYWTSFFLNKFTLIHFVPCFDCFCFDRFCFDRRFALSMTFPPTITPYNQELTVYGNARTDI
jgi:hypothetical protein